ncbi:MAG: hypothetical protein ACFFBQ_21270, partial [Promethearchaeota archaeon]
SLVNNKRIKINQRVNIILSKFNNINQRILKEMVKTVCGSDIDYKGFLVVESDKPEQKKNLWYFNITNNDSFFVKNPVKKSS